VDKDWNYVNEDVIRISGLPYGKFVLHVKAQLESGSWNAQEIVIPITVLKPFYLETWFFVSLFILMVMLFLMFHLMLQVFCIIILKLLALLISAER
jgi:hypothetical protein